MGGALILSAMLLWRAEAEASAERYLREGRPYATVEAIMLAVELGADSPELVELLDEANRQILVSHGRTESG